MSKNSALDYAAAALKDLRPVGNQKQSKQAPPPVQRQGAPQITQNQQQGKGKPHQPIKSVEDNWEVEQRRLEAELSRLRYENAEQAAARKRSISPDNRSQDESDIDESDLPEEEEIEGEFETPTTKVVSEEVSYGKRSIYRASQPVTYNMPPIALGGVNNLVLTRYFQDEKPASNWDELFHKQPATSVVRRSVGKRAF
jgi:hypothetical protein